MSNGKGERRGEHENTACAGTPAHLLYHHHTSPPQLVTAPPSLSLSLSLSLSFYLTEPPPLAPAPRRPGATIHTRTRTRENRTQGVSPRETALAKGKHQKDELDHDGLVGDMVNLRRS